MTVPTPTNIKLHFSLGCPLLFVFMLSSFPFNFFFENNSFWFVFVLFTRIYDNEQYKWQNDQQNTSSKIITHLHICVVIDHQFIHLYSSALWLWAGYWEECVDASLPLSVYCMILAMKLCALLDSISLLTLFVLMRVELFALCLFL